MLEYGYFFFLTFYIPHCLASLQCYNTLYKRRISFDNLLFPNALAPGDIPVESRAECVSKCQWKSICNQVIYNDVTKMCRLYPDSLSSSSGGSLQVEWQYYGASCDIYRIGNSLSTAHVLKDEPDDVCVPDHHALITCPPTSCFSGGTWLNIAVKCTFTLFQYTDKDLDPATIHTVHLPFDLPKGHVISIRVQGTSTQENYVEFLDESGDIPYHVSLRFQYNNPLMAFNTNNGGWGEQKNLWPLGDYISNASDYTVDTHIGDNEFKTYGDGKLMQTNAMRWAFPDVRKVRVKGIINILKFKIGYDIC